MSVQDPYEVIVRLKTPAERAAWEVAQAIRNPHRAAWKNRRRQEQEKDAWRLVYESFVHTFGCMACGAVPNQQCRKYVALHGGKSRFDVGEPFHHCDIEDRAHADRRGKATRAANLRIYGNEQGKARVRQ